MYSKKLKDIIKCEQLQLEVLSSSLFYILQPDICYLIRNIY